MKIKGSNLVLTVFAVLILMGDCFFPAQDFGNKTGHLSGPDSAIILLYQIS
jgi:hypothetical protein